LSSEQVDEYLRALEEPKRGTLETLRRTILPFSGSVLGQLGRLAELARRADV
jgi:hypothetical protein